MNMEGKAVKVFILITTAFVVVTRIPASSAAVVLRYSGCYGGCGKFGSYMISYRLLNEDCVSFCGGKAYVYAATRRIFCGCANSLLSLLPINGRAGEDNASGPRSQCKNPCPGKKS